MIKKYELVLDDTIDFFGRKLFRIRALTSFGSVKAGELGGYIEKEENLSHDGNAWVAGNAIVCDDAEVKGNATVSGNAKVYDDAQISGNARIYGNALVHCDAKVYGNAELLGNATVSGNSEVLGNALVYNDALISGNAKIYDHAKVYDNALVNGNVKLSGYAKVYDNAEVSGDSEISGNSEVSGNALVTNTEDIVVFKNHWSSHRHFTYTKSNKMWRVGCFYGTGQELIKKAYADSENSGKHYKAYVDFVERLDQLGRDIYTWI